MALPSWFRPSKYARNQSLNVARGRHPMGMPLADNDETCGSCAHLVKKTHGRNYYKCRKYRNTCGPATDIRLRWPACSLWTPLGGGDGNA